MLFDGSITPNLTSITPRHGTVQGNEIITFTGTGFSATKEDITITIDGKFVCPVESSTLTEIKCKTVKRPGFHKTSLLIHVKGKGYVALNNQLFTYVNYWSHDTTWGMEFAPMAMESIHIPTGLNLYMDIDKTPELNLLIIEGQLIIAPHPTDKTH